MAQCELLARLVSTDTVSRFLTSVLETIQEASACRTQNCLRIKQATPDRQTDRQTNRTIAPSRKASAFTRWSLITNNALKSWDPWARPPGTTLFDNVTPDPTE